MREGMIACAAGALQIPEQMHLHCTCERLELVGIGSGGACKSLNGLLNIGRGDRI